MSDIIEKAKNLEAYCIKVNDFRDIREVAQALAKDTWEYAVQVKIGAKWLFLGRGVGGHNFAKNALWFDKKEKAQEYQLIRQDTAPTRLICRRVSPPEVLPNTTINPAAAGSTESDK